MTGDSDTYRNWAGAKWWRCDLHTHTPASLDYGNGPDKERFIAITPKDWLLLYMRSNIDCIAITDHNSGGWISRVQDAYQSLKDEGNPEFREICILPGVEITASGGIHILGIFHSKLLSECTVDDPGVPGRRHFMEKRGEGVPLILKEGKRLSNIEPQYTLLDNCELLFTIYAAPEP